MHRPCISSWHFMALVAPWKGGDERSREKKGTGKKEGVGGGMDGWTKTALIVKYAEIICLNSEKLYISK